MGASRSSLVRTRTEKLRAHARDLAAQQQRTEQEIKRLRTALKRAPSLQQATNVAILQRFNARLKTAQTQVLDLQQNLATMQHTEAIVEHLQANAELMESCGALGSKEALTELLGRYAVAAEGLKGTADMLAVEDETLMDEARAILGGEVEDTGDVWDAYEARLNATQVALS